MEITILTLVAYLFLLENAYKNIFVAPKYLWKFMIIVLEYDHRKRFSELLGMTKTQRPAVVGV